MENVLPKRQKNFFIKIVSTILSITFISTTAVPPSYAQVLNLPQPGSMVGLTPAFMPTLIKGLKVHPENPLLFDFILDTGKSGIGVNTPEFKSESEKLIKYFLASMTIKESDLWVNLSPYEKNRIATDELGKTELGKDMLAQDYILKQLTASLMYPEKEIGKDFWNKVYAEAKQKFGTTDIPTDTFNKVWIVADKAKIFEHNDAAYVVGAHLKVMLEKDYVAASKASSSHSTISPLSSPQSLSGDPVVDSRLRGNDISTSIIKEIIIPAIEKEVNEGKNFATLRQMFYSMILATWYKQALKDALLNQVYSDKAKIGGVTNNDPNIKEKIYAQYFEAFKKGAYNYIKEEYDPTTQQVTPKKYFSGGLEIGVGKVLARQAIQTPETDNAMKPNGDMAMVTTNIHNLKQIKADVKKNQEMKKKNNKKRGLYSALSDVKFLGGDSAVVKKAFNGNVSARQELVDSARYRFAIDGISRRNWAGEVLSTFARSGHVWAQNAIVRDAKDDSDDDMRWAKFALFDSAKHGWDWAIKQVAILSGDDEEFREVISKKLNSDNRGSQEEVEEILIQAIRNGQVWAKDLVTENIVSRHEYVGIHVAAETYEFFSKTQQKKIYPKIKSYSDELNKLNKRLQGLEKQGKSLDRAMTTLLVIPASESAHMTLKELFDLLQEGIKKNQDRGVTEAEGKYQGMNFKVVMDTTLGEDYEKSFRPRFEEKLKKNDIQKDKAMTTERKSTWDQVKAFTPGTVDWHIRHLFPQFSAKGKIRAIKILSRIYEKNNPKQQARIAQALFEVAGNKDSSVSQAAVDAIASKLKVTGIEDPLKQLLNGLRNQAGVDVGKDRLLTTADAQIKIKAFVASMKGLLIAPFVNNSTMATLAEFANNVEKDVYSAKTRADWKRISERLAQDKSRITGFIEAIAGREPQSVFSYDNFLKEQLRKEMYTAFQGIISEAGEAMDRPTNAILINASERSLQNNPLRLSLLPGEGVVLNVSSHAWQGYYRHHSFLLSADKDGNLLASPFKLPSFLSKDYDGRTRQMDYETFYDSFQIYLPHGLTLWHSDGFSEDADAGIIHNQGPTGANLAIDKNGKDLLLSVGDYTSSPGSLSAGVNSIVLPKEKEIVLGNGTDVVHVTLDKEKTKEVQMGGDTVVLEEKDDYVLVSSHIKDGTIWAGVVDEGTPDEILAALDKGEQWALDILDRDLAKNANLEKVAYILDAGIQNNRDWAKKRIIGRDLNGQYRLQQVVKDRYYSGGAEGKFSWLKDVIIENAKLPGNDWAKEIVFGKEDSQLMRLENLLIDARKNAQSAQSFSEKIRHVILNGHDDSDYVVMGMAMADAYAGLTWMVNPMIEWLQDNFDNRERLDVAVAVVFSLLPPEVREKIFKDLEQTDPKGLSSLRRVISAFSSDLLNKQRSMIVNRYSDSVNGPRWSWGDDGSKGLSMESRENHKATIQAAQSITNKELALTEIIKKSSLASVYMGQRIGMRYNSLAARGDFAMTTEQPENQSRRNFLKNSAVITAGLLAGKGMLLAQAIKPNLRPEVKKTVEWLKHKINPQTGLIASFEGTPAGDPSTGVTWMYNQAQAIEVFLSIGDIKTAESLAKAMLKLEKHNGAWVGAYDTQSGKIATNIDEQRLSYVGFNMAIGHSFLNLLEKTQDKKLAINLLQASFGLMRWIAGYYHDKGNYGYFSGGENKAAVWTEYNVRAAAFYYQFANQLKDPNHPNKKAIEEIISPDSSKPLSESLRKDAEKVFHWVSGMWNKNQGYYEYGYTDSVKEKLIPEDWGNFEKENPKYWAHGMWAYPQYLVPIMARVAGLNPKDYAGGLGWVLNHQSTIVVNKNGQKVNLSGVPRWIGSRSINSKFTGEMAVALRLVGRDLEADKLLATLTQLQTPDGGIPEAVSDNPNDMWPLSFPYASVEASLAYIIGMQHLDPRYIAGTTQLAGNDDAAMTTATVKVLGEDMPARSVLKTISALQQDLLFSNITDERNTLNELVYGRKMIRLNHFTQRAKESPVADYNLFRELEKFLKDTVSFDIAILPLNGTPSLNGFRPGFYLNWKAPNEKMTQKMMMSAQLWLLNKALESQKALKGAGISDFAMTTGDNSTSSWEERQLAWEERIRQRDEEERRNQRRHQEAQADYENLAMNLFGEDDAMMTGNLRVLSFIGALTGSLLFTGQGMAANDPLASWIDPKADSMEISSTKMGYYVGQTIRQDGNTYIWNSNVNKYVPLKRTPKKPAADTSNTHKDTTAVVPDSSKKAKDQAMTAGDDDFDSFLRANRMRMETNETREITVKNVLGIHMKPSRAIYRAAEAFAKQGVFVAIETEGDFVRIYDESEAELTMHIQGLGIQDEQPIMVTIDSKKKLSPETINFVFDRLTYLLQTPALLENPEWDTNNATKTYLAEITQFLESHDKAMNADMKNPGGIDLNAKNLQMNISKDGKGVEFKFDPAMVEQFKLGDFTGVIPVIIRITPISSPFPLLGLEIPTEQAIEISKRS
ncbi:MAG: hypothetical protein HQL24_04710 [Candidatus Omnitrophica bacterium]|nr:hypothetical protein [Candidatus Omnitrophota bacterium]